MTMIDNRDLTTTWIHSKVEVDPWDLVINAIENTGIPMEVQDELVKELETFKEKVVNLADL